MQISDQALIFALRALSLGTKNNPEVCKQILSYENSLKEFFDYLKYPHKGIKI
jgi:hypothetical protein